MNTRTVLHTALESTGVGVQAPSSLTQTFEGATPQTSSPLERIGYATGAGAAVTQGAGARTNAVTINAPCGAITTDNTSLAAGAEAKFTVNNSVVQVGDVVVVALRSGATAGTSIPVVSAIANGSFEITLTNLHAATADTGASIINFAVIKAVSA